MSSVLEITCDSSLQLFLIAAGEEEATGAASPPTPYKRIPQALPLEGWEVYAAHHRQESLANGWGRQMNHTMGYWSTAAPMGAPIIGGKPVHSNL